MKKFIRYAALFTGGFYSFSAAALRSLISYDKAPSLLSWQTCVALFTYLASAWYFFIIFNLIWGKIWAKAWGDAKLSCEADLALRASTEPLMAGPFGARAPVLLLVALIFIAFFILQLMVAF